MTFEYPWLFLLLLLAIPFVLLWQNAARRRQQRLRKFTDAVFADRLLAGNSNNLRMWHFILFSLACFFLVLAISGPTLRGGKEKVKLTGIDIIIALDVSNSMRAQDVHPSRLERAKLALSELLQNAGDDRIGLVVFAGHAYPSLPLTNDRDAAETVIRSASTEMVSVQGTAIGSAIEQATTALANDDEDRGKAIVVVSDGENHEDDAAAAATEAAKKGIIVCSVGVGTDAGAKIPEKDMYGNATGFKHDENGNEVVTKLDAQDLEEIAQAGKGIYVHDNSSDLGIGKVYSQLENLRKSTKETYRYTSLTPLFPWVLIVSILLFLVEAMLPAGKREENKFEG